jgi:hypothetical protein
LAHNNNSRKLTFSSQGFSSVREGQPRSDMPQHAMSKLNPPEALRSEKIRGWLLESLDVTDKSSSGDDVVFADAHHNRFPESFKHTSTAFTERHVLLLPVGLMVHRSIPFA